MAASKGMPLPRKRLARPADRNLSEMLDDLAEEHGITNLNERSNTMRRTIIAAFAVFAMGMIAYYEGCLGQTPQPKHRPGVPGASKYCSLPQGQRRAAYLQDNPGMRSVLADLPPAGREAFWRQASASAGCTF